MKLKIKVGERELECLLSQDKYLAMAKHSQELNDMMFVYLWTGRKILKKKLSPYLLVYKEVVYPGRMMIW